MSSQESQCSALCALLKHSWTRRSVIMSDVMMRVDQEPVLWPGHMGLQVGGQRSEHVLPVSVDQLWDVLLTHLHPAVRLHVVHYTHIHTHKHIIHTHTHTHTLYTHKHTHKTNTLEMRGWVIILSATASQTHHPSYFIHTSSQSVVEWCCRPLCGHVMLQTSVVMWCCRPLCGHVMLQTLF